MKRSLLLIFSFILIFSGKVFSEDITILFASDTHTNLSPGAPRTPELAGKMGGIARAATYINQVRQEDPSRMTLLLHGGDAFVGDILFNSTMGLRELQAMQMLGYDAMVLGNHEFDLTPGGLQGILSVSLSLGLRDFTILSANLNYNNPEVAGLGNLVGAMYTKDNGTIKVGVFGLTTPQTNFYSQSDIVLENVDSIAAADVAFLKSINCNIIICLSHMGYINDRRIAETIPGIDIIIGGHDHRRFSSPEIYTNTGTKTYLVQAGAFYRNMGRFDISYNNSAIETLDYNLIEIDEEIAEDTDMKHFIDSLELDADNVFGMACFTQQVAYAEDEFWETNINLLQEGNKDTPVGNLVTDAFLAAVPEADIAIEPCGSTAQYLYTGPVVANDIYRMIGYGFSEGDGTLHYKLVTFDLPAMQLLIGLQISLKSIDLDDELFVQCAGLEYSYYANHDSLDRLIIDSVRVKGEPIKLDSTYKIVTNEFVAELFAGMLGSALQNKVVIDSINEFSAVLNYAMQLQDLTPKSEGRIKALIDSTIGVEEITIYKQSLKIYPNPVKGTSIISFNVSEQGIYSMKLFNSYGQEISEVFNQSLESGYQTKILDVSELSSGFYFVRLTNGRNTQSVKMIVE